MKKRKTFFIFVALILILLFGALFFILKIRRTDDISSLKTYVVQEKTVKPYISVSGEIYPDRIHELFYSAKATVREVYVKPGDFVKEGEVLSIAESPDVESSLKSAKINLDSQKERLNQLRDAYDQQIAQISRQIDYVKQDLAEVENQLSNFKSQLKQLLETSPQPLPDALKAQVDGLNQKISALESQKKSLVRSINDLGSNLTSTKAKKESDLKLAHLQLRQAELAYHKEKENVEKLKLTSPVNGEVVFVGIEPGKETASTNISASLTGVEAGSQIPSASSGKSVTPAFIIAEQGWMPKAEIYLDQMDVIRVKEGMQAVAQLDALPGKVLKGKVETVNRYPVKGSSQANTYRAVIVFTEKPAELLPGMTAIINIYLQKIKGLAVPTSSIRFVNGIPYVYLVSNGLVKPLKVDVGESDDSYTIIKKGLKKGQKIVLDIATLDRLISSGSIRVESEGSRSTNSSLRRTPRMFR